MILVLCQSQMLHWHFDNSGKTTKKKGTALKVFLSLRELLVKRTALF